jgi:xylulokinase
MTYLLGIDLGSSSIKAALLDVRSGASGGTAFYPKAEQHILAPEPGFAEQDPHEWYRNLCRAVRELLAVRGVSGDQIGAVGISYQMHGLVCVDGARQVLRPAIIWCDSRAIPYGQKALEGIGFDRCMTHMLNSPGNFTAAKLAWVKANEPDLFSRIETILLPGDWLAMMLTGEAATTVSGLSEGVFWDFLAEAPSRQVLEWFGFAESLLAPIVPTFGIQGELTARAADDLGLRKGTPVAYRAGDQPNNAFSLNVLAPGEIAATAGTSGVVYGVTDARQYDPESRVNSFAHVNHRADRPRIGVLLCINGTGILNAWTRRMLGIPDYGEMNRLAHTADVGSGGIVVLPFGNGAERMLGNRNPGARIIGIDFNRHGRPEICRAVQEGVAFSLVYGMEMMRSVGLDLKTIRAAHANMFLSDIFCDILAGAGGAKIELYETDGALGAARGAGIGAGIYFSFEEAFAGLSKRREVMPRPEIYAEAYGKWRQTMEKTVFENYSERNK